MSIVSSIVVVFGFSFSHVHLSFILVLYIRRKALVILLMSMVNEKQPFALRCAVLYVFECYVYRNDAGKVQVIQTLLPSSAAQGA